MDFSGYRKCPWMSTLALALTMAMIAAAGVFAASDNAAHDDEGAFLAENEAAMSKMMAAMAAKPSGDVDKDFVATMVPHHQGAIEMAQAELRHGHNEQLRRIAQEIIVDQTQEIAAMKLAIEGESRK
ncbi:MAG: hypothetical protein JWO52_1876 [Gammaproteobacteria bacterium]|nr:hypothetical protein [Gammaproteobacteria bacterium]